ncbi:MAG: pantoate--beta-alanine ligase [Micromonosporaceae bacterium]|nr:pantoate--beta-alanine ligase [Micromonosporaceae bacterium]
MRVVQDRASLAEARDALTGRVAVVMTMGALHEGHASLLAAARAAADAVICTIFVNPLQFGPNEDLDRYPRSLDADLAVCERHGVDVVFTPTEDVIYPYGQPQIRVNPGSLGETLEGASRPGFFHGVLTVVLKLLHLTRPDIAYFGEKDYQQISLVRRMVRDLDVPTEIVAAPTIREADGLALSSRNRYLSPEERAAALTLSRALFAGQEAASEGPAKAAQAAQDVIDAEPRVRPDYLVLTGTDLGPAPQRGEARLLVAARMGRTRLIDNVRVTLRSSEGLNPDEGRDPTSGWSPARS